MAVPSAVGRELPQFTLRLAPGTDHHLRLQYKTAVGASIPGVIEVRIGDVLAVTGTPCDDGVAVVTISRAANTLALIGRPVTITHISANGARAALARGSVRRA